MFIKANSPNEALEMAVVMLRDERVANAELRDELAAANEEIERLQRQVIALQLASRGTTQLAQTAGKTTRPREWRTQERRITIITEQI